MRNTLFPNIGSWMKGKRSSLIGLGLLVIGLVAFMAFTPNSLRSEYPSYRAKLLINNSFPGTALLSDGQRDGWYIDHLLSGGDPCVTAWVNATQLFFIYMDYTGETGHDCSSSLGVPLRTYTLKFPAPWGDITVADKSPRIRIEKLFSKKPTAPVAFLFYKDGVSYEVRPDVEVPITVSGNTRTLTYAGTAKLWKITTPKESGPITFSFWFPFQLIVERVAQ